MPAVFAVLTLLACALTLCFKCCAVCCSCLGKCCGDSKDRTYTNKQRWVPLILLAVFAAVAMGMSAAGISESGKLSETLLKRPADVNDTSTLSFRAFVPNTVTRLQRKVQSLREPALEVDATIALSVSNAQDIFNEVIDDIETGIDDLLAAMNAYSAEYENLEVSAADGVTYECAACAGVATALSSASSELDSGAATTVADMRELVDSFNSSLVEELPEIEDQVRDLLQQLDDADDDLEQARNTSDDIIDNLEEYDPTRHLVTTIVFTVPIAALAVAFVGALLKSGLCFKVNMWTYFLVCFVFWLLFAVHLPLAVVLSDACQYVEEYEQTEVRERALRNGEDDKPYVVAVACLDNTNLVDALGYRDELNFTEQINLPDFPNVTEQFDLDGFLDLNALVGTITGSTITSFGFDPAVVEASWEEFRDDNPGLVPGTVTNADEFVASDNMGNVDYIAAQTNTQNLITTLAQLEARLAEMDSDTTDLNDELDRTKNSVVAASNNVTDVNAILDPLIALADEVIDLATCEEAGDAYREAQALVCDSVSRHLTTIALSLFIVAFFGWFIIYLSNKNAKRWGKPDPIVVGGDDDDADYDGMPMKRLDSESRLPAAADEAYYGGDPEAPVPPAPAPPAAVPNTTPEGASAPPAAASGTYY